MKITKSQLKQVILETLEEAKHRYASDPDDYKNQITGRLANFIEEFTGGNKNLANEAAKKMMLQKPLSDIISMHIYGFALEEEKEDLSNE